MQFNKLHFLIYPGWALSASDYKLWLQPYWDINPANINIIERNYFNQLDNKQTNIIKTQDNQHIDNYLTLLESNRNPLIVIAHSLGLHFVPAKIVEQSKLLVIISSFAKFYSNDLNEHKYELKIIKRMKTQLKNNPQLLLSEFRKNCGLPIVTDYQDLNPQKINYNQLNNDLEFLELVSLDLSALKVIPNVLIMHGRNDKIINVNKAWQLKTYFETNLKSTTVKLLINIEANHALPILQTQFCLDKILQDYQERLSNL